MKMIKRSKNISLILIARLTVLGVFSLFFSQSFNVQHHSPFDVTEGDADVIRQLEISAFNPGTGFAPLRDVSTGGITFCAGLLSSPFILASVEVESRPFFAIVVENPPHAPPADRLS